jgi:hypothetical protein
MVLRRQILMVGLARSQGSCWLLERTGITAPDNRVSQPPDKLQLFPLMVEAGCHFVIGLSAEGLADGAPRRATEKWRITPCQ